MQIIHIFGQEDEMVFGPTRSCLSIPVVAVVFCLMAVSSFATDVGSNEETSSSPEDATALITAESIVQLTYDSNMTIAAARYDLLRSKYAFEEFERELSQFTPLIVKSDVERDSWRSPDDRGRRTTATDYAYRTRVGMQKDYFNGSSIFGGVGFRGDVGDSGRDSNPYLEGEAEFPLWSSYTTLRRVTQRSFEENELLNARLDYVDSVRSIIQDSQEDFFWLQVMREKLRLSIDAVQDYHQLLALPCVKDSSADLRLVEDALAAANSDLTDNRTSVDSYRVLLQDILGIDILELARVEATDLHAEQYYGMAYLKKTPEQILKEAYENDAEMRLLEIARKDAELKRNLAERGSWDIFGRLNVAADLEGSGELDRHSGYSVGLGVSIRRIDPGLRQISLEKAQAEIDKFGAEIKRRTQELRNFVERKTTIATSLRKQASQREASLVSRRQVYDQKVEAYRNTDETMDNVIAARQKLYSSGIDLAYVFGEFFEIITELDESTGVYFAKLGIHIDSPTSDETQN